jgi:hypothetical protein
MFFFIEPEQGSEAWLQAAEHMKGCCKPDRNWIEQ